MKTRSKVKSVQGSGTWNGKDGTTFYKFDYEMEDGTLLQASHKKPESFPEGAEVDYEVKRDHEVYGKAGTVSKPNDFQSNSGDNLKGIKIGHAITNAVQLTLADYNQYPDHWTTGNIEKDIKDYAKMIYKISEELNNEL